MTFEVESTNTIIGFASALCEFDFLRNALLINLITGLITAPLGLFLVLRRMSLMGDALSHALLPGVAASYFFFGYSIPMMILGGFVAGSTVVALTVWAQRHSSLKEESNFAAFYLLALAIGVLAISIKGSSVDLMHILFGSALTADALSLKIAMSVTGTVGLVFWFWRRFFTIEIFDPVYLQSRGHSPLFYQSLFLVLVVGCLVVCFQTNGTLLAMGQLLLPGIIMRVWSQRLRRLVLGSILISFAGSIGGLWLSYYQDWPLGPSTLLLWGGAFIFSLLINPEHGLLKPVFPRKHFEN